MTLGKLLTVLVRPQKMRYVAERPLQKTKKIRALLTGTFCILVVGFLFGGVQLAAFTFSRHNVAYATAHDSLASLVTAPELNQILPNQKEPLEVVAAINSQALQKVIDTWSATVKGSGSVVVLDGNTGQRLAGTQQDKEYFTASIYKLYVAYFALQDIDAGIHSFDDQFLNGQTRAQCIDNMIRNSDSPCGEKMMNETPLAVLQQRVNDLGLSGTSLVKFTTTATDTAHVTQMVATGQGLSRASTELLHTAMHLQKYRQGLQTGFEGLDVYDKIGFYQVGWHDSAFVRLPSGKLVVVTVLTQDVSSMQVNALAKKLQPLLMGS
jgi:beta-lactamase class A